MHWNTNAFQFSPRVLTCVCMVNSEPEFVRKPTTRTYSQFFFSVSLVRGAWRSAGSGFLIGPRSTSATTERTTTVTRYGIVVVEKRARGRTPYSRPVARRRRRRRLAVEIRRPFPRRLFSPSFTAAVQSESGRRTLQHHTLRRQSVLSAAYASLSSPHGPKRSQRLPTRCKTHNRPPAKQPVVVVVVAARSQAITHRPRAENGAVALGPT